MTVLVKKGDITRMRCDAIVNAANARLIPGGGVDGAINKAAGPELGQIMRSIGGTPTGTAVHTSAFKLPAQFVIHTVGPIYADHKPADARRLLAAAYNSAITLANQLGCETINFPLISTGVYGYPLDEACAIAVAECNRRCLKNQTITLVAFDDAMVTRVEKAIQQWRAENKAQPKV